MLDTRTIVIGGGVVGAAAAYFLARRGAAVTLLQRDDPALSASAGNAGLVAVGHGPLPRPGLPMRAARWVFDPASPLHIPPRPSLALLRWLWGFRRACTPAHYAHCFAVLAEHGRHAGACFRAIVEDESIDCEFRPLGQMDVYRTGEGMHDGGREADLAEAYGFRVERIGGDELRRREPAVRAGAAGAIIYRDRAFADPRAFLLALVDRARRHGADVRVGGSAAEMIVDGGRVRAVRTAEGERLDAGAVVLAAGAWTTALARQAGVRVPMEAAKGYHVMLDRPSPCLEMAAVLAERFVAVNPMAGALRLAGTLEFSGISARVVPRRAEALVHGARLYLDGIGSAPVRSTWCGLRPCTADGLPVLGWAPGVGNLFIATGHAMMGFALGPLAGRAAAECVLDGRASIDLSPFDPARFTRRGPTAARAARPVSAAPALTPPRP